MADNQPPKPGSQSLEGVELRQKTSEELANAVDLAFDYRGDVTIQLQSGEVIEGYVFDRHAEVRQPFLQLFPKDLPGTRKVFYQDIAAVIFSGEDTAFGKSWEDWFKKSPKRVSGPLNVQKSNRIERVLVSILGCPELCAGTLLPARVIRFLPPRV